MAKAAKSFKDSGMNVFARWNMIFNTPPLVITEQHLQDGLDGLDKALNLIDPYYEG